MAEAYDHDRRWGFDVELTRRVAQELRRKRKQLGLTQAELAKICGVSQKTISRLELAKDNLTITKLERYVGALGDKISISFPIDGHGEDSEKRGIYSILWNPSKPSLYIDSFLPPGTENAPSRLDALSESLVLSSALSHFPGVCNPSIVARVAG